MRLSQLASPPLASCRRVVLSFSLRFARVNRLLAKTAGNHPQDQLQPARFQHVPVERTLTSLVVSPLDHTTMNIITRFLAMLLVSVSAAQCAEPAAKQFLRYIYGADGIEFTNVCHPSDDAWMLRGAKDTNALVALDSLKVSSKTNGVTSGLVGRDMYFVETREGKVDPAVNLEGVYARQRQLVLQFIYSALSQNQRMLRQIVTDASKVKIDGPKDAPPGGDMDVYGPIIGQLPVVRSSKPQEDAKSRTVAYRVPLGEEALVLTLVKEGSTWKVDTSKSVRLSLEFFYR